MLSRDTRKQAILQASQRVFSSRPYDEISIDEIAAEASMSKGLLYHYFASKRDLYLETLRSVFAMISQIPENAHDLHTCLNDFLVQFEQSPALMRMVFRGGINLDAEVEALLAAFRQHQFALFVQTIGNKTPVSPLLQLGLRGWISFFLEVCLQWGEQQNIPREQVVILLEQSLRAISSLEASTETRCDPT